MVLLTIAVVRRVRSVVGIAQRYNASLCSLQSPHCRLHKLALYHCTIPTTDHTLLTTAIVSSTTITHLLFIDRDIDTPSVTALVSGLKQNKTMKELAIYNYFTNFTEKQFQLLIEGVDSSAVK